MKLKQLILIILTILIFYILLTQIDAKSVMQILSNANLFYILGSILILALLIPLAVFRWQIILKVTGHPLPFWRCFNIFMAALPLTSISPSKSGDVVKAYCLKDEFPISKTIGTVYTERVFDLFSLIFLSFAGSLFYRNTEFLMILTPALLIVAVLFITPNANIRIPFIKDSWNRKLQGVMLSMRSLTRCKKEFLVVTLLSLISWMLAVFQTMLFFNALNISIPLAFTMANIPIAIFVGMMPVTLGGMGTRDAAIIYLFSEFGTPSELLGVGILFSLIRYWFLSIIGLAFMKNIVSSNFPTNKISSQPK